MYPRTKFQLIWRTSDFGAKFAQKKTLNKRINMKFEMRIEHCTSVPNFSQFGELQFLRPNLPKETLGQDIRANST